MHAKLDSSYHHWHALSIVTWSFIIYIKTEGSNMIPNHINSSRNQWNHYWNLQITLMAGKILELQKSKFSLITSWISLYITNHMIFKHLFGKLESLESNWRPNHVNENFGGFGGSLPIRQSFIRQSNVRSHEL